MTRFIGVLAWAAMAAATEDTVSIPASQQAENIRSVGLAICATITIIGSVFGSAYAVARIGSAALGAAAEKPELLLRSVLILALAEGLAVLGFVIAMVILQKI